MQQTRNLVSSDQLEARKECLATDGDSFNDQAVSFGNEIKHTTKSLDEFGIHPNEGDIPSICDLMDSSLSEPYNIWTYRFFVHQYPDLTYLAFDRRTNKCVAAIMAKIGLDCEDSGNQGYIGMLAVDPAYRRIGLGRRLVRMVLDVMHSRYNCLMCYLDTEFTNIASLNLYESFGFIRDNRFEKYYLNRNDAFRLRLLFQPSPIETNNGKNVYIHQPPFDFKEIMTGSALNVRDKEKTVKISD